MGDGEDDDGGGDAWSLVCTWTLPYFWANAGFPTVVTNPSG